MPQPQSAIIPHTAAHGSFISLKLNNTENSVASLRAASHRLASLVTDIIAERNEPSLSASISFSAEAWRQLSSQQPSQLKSFVNLGEGNISAHATNADIFFHCHSNAKDINFLLCQRFLATLSNSVSVINETQGFLFLDNRDFTGFIDGTENPEETQERCDVALIGKEDADFIGGSYLLAMRFIHDLNKWELLDVSEQEHIIGRTKADSIELDANSLAETTHISRVVIEEDGDELEILRHSMPYGKASGEKGLFFLAYCKRLDIYEKMLAHMYAETPDGIHDHLMGFSKSAENDYFFTPSLSLLDSWAE